MHISFGVLLSFAFVLVWTGMSFCGPIPADSMARPTRPKAFSSPDELKNYLEQLGNFYAIAGRPRFGKRMLAPWMANYVRDDPEAFRGLPISNTELLQILSSLNQNQDK